MNKTIKAFLAIVVMAMSNLTAWAYSDEPVKVTWAMNSTADPNAHTTTLEEVFQTIAFNVGSCSVVGTDKITDKSNTTVCATALKIAPAVGKDDVLSWELKPTPGLTFTPTHFTGYVNRCGTDVENGLTISAKMGNGSVVKLGTWTALRSGKGINKDYDNSGIAKYDITLTADQQAKLAGAETFMLTATIGVGSGRQAAFGEVVVEGKISGTPVQVNKYTVGIQGAPAEGGSVSIYPVNAQYVENTEVTLTATENFGYDFVNWTDAKGNVLSTEPKFTHVVTSDISLTANFKKVNTYALNINVDGGAKDYMVLLNPAPNVVDGKNMYEAGTKVTLTATENKILTFNSWSTGATEKEIVVAMDGEQTLTADYSAIDFIAAWDFILPGNNGRKADFYAAENDAVSLVLRDEAGNTFGWLDKSEQGAGGYEGRPGGVNWQKEVPIGTTYWETKVNAGAFTDIKVVTAMVYNYNAYTTYNVEASLDGKTWEKVGAIKMEGVKNWKDGTFSLPAKYNNQNGVSIRWIADKTSSTDGTVQSNDGACIGATYILGTAKLVDDGTAPVFVSSVPAEGANNASANGKVVLTFDEKVKAAEVAVATLGGKTLTPVVSGKTVSFEYKGLEYSTSYTFSLPANSISDLTDNFIADAITINFQTKTKPAINKAQYDIVVGMEEGFSSLSAEEKGAKLVEAVVEANKHTSQTDRFRILIAPGEYVIPTKGTKTGGDGKTYGDPRTNITGNNISFIGLDYENTTITNITPPATWDNGFGIACPLEGIGAGDVFINMGTGNYFQGITIKSSLKDATGRGIALNDQGNKTILKNARLWGYQDTYVSNNERSRFYIENGVIRGRTDYICGKGDVWYEQVTFQQVKSGYLAVPSKPTKYGYILNKCTVKSDGTGSSNADGSYTLGRPWGSGTPIALYLNCVFEAVPSAEGWNEMSGGWPARFAEYNSVTKSGTPIDLSKRKKTFGDHPNCNNPILTAVEAAEYTMEKVIGGTDGWDPTVLTEQASAPSNVVLDKEKQLLSWDASDYALCWVVCVNGVPVKTTIDNTIDFSDCLKGNPDLAADKVTVLAANEAGGLSEATQAKDGSATGIATFRTPTSAPVNGKIIRNNQILIVRDGKTYTVTGTQKH